MAVQIKLDAPAVRALIQDNDEFRVELQSAVIAEIVRSQFHNRLTEIVPLIFPEVTRMIKEAAHEEVWFEQALQKAFDSLFQSSKNYMRGKELSPATQKSLEDKVQPVIQAGLDQITVKFQLLAKEAVQKVVDSLDDRIEKRLSSLLEDEIRIRVRDGVRAKIETALTK